MEPYDRFKNKMKGTNKNLINNTNGSVINKEDNYTQSNYISTPCVTWYAIYAQLIKA